MLTIPHFIWLFISIAIVCVTLYFVLKKKPKLDKVLTVCCIVCIISEFIKVFSQIKMIPDMNGNYYPYLSRAHLPFHLCSLRQSFYFCCSISPFSCCFSPLRSLTALDLM